MERIEHMRNPNTLLILLWLAGAAVVASGVFMDWLEIQIALTDGTDQTITASGLELYTRYGGTGMPVDGSAPVSFLLIAVAVAMLALICYRRREGSMATIGFTMLVFLSIVMVTGSMAVDSMVMYAHPPPGTDVSGIPEWLADIASGDVSHATTSGSYGYIVSAIGLFVSFAAAMLFFRRGAS